MIINNFNLIKSLLSFESEDEFYFLQILKRKKENPEIGSNPIVIKTYYVSSIESFDRYKEEIRSLCHLHNARAYIHLDKRSYKRIAFHTLKKISDCIMNEDYKAVKNAYNSACGKYSTEKKSWVIDVDNNNFDEVLTLAEEINLCKSGFDPNVLTFVPTINGWHIITHPFDRVQLNNILNLVDYTIQTNNPTFLYYGG